MKQELDTSTHWIYDLKTLNKEIKNRLITKKDLLARLNILLKKPECPISGIEYEIIGPMPFNRIRIGVPKIIQKRILSDEYIMTLADSRISKCHLKVWKKEKSIDGSKDIMKELKSLLRNYWKSYFRTLPTGLIDIKRSLKIRNLAKSTFAYISKEQSAVSLLYCDIDNFKEVNLRFGMTYGDGILKEIGAILESLTIDTAILLHNSGDEFVILAVGSPRSAKMLAEDIKRGIAYHNFGADSVRLSISIGIASSYGIQEFENIFESSYKSIQIAKKTKNNSYQ